MKNLKKALAMVVAVATLGTVSAVSTSAVEWKTDEIPSWQVYYVENAITEAIIYVDDGENSGTYYYKSPLVEASIDISSLSKKDLGWLNSCVPVKLDDSVDVSAVEKVIYINAETGENTCIPIDCGSYYTDMFYDNCYWSTNLSSIPKETTEDTTIGDSTATDDATIGDSDSTEPSETTLQRGDVNGDGKINATDLLQLKKYILGLIDTLG
jgi:hypothetical protein